MNTETNWKNTMKTYKITLICEVRETSRSKGVAGIAYTEAWWKTFTYWISTKLGAEGLYVTSTKIRELVEDQDDAITLQPLP